MDVVSNIRELRLDFRCPRCVEGRDLLTYSVFCSSSLSKILGYADSDYVVENITIRIPP